MAVRQQGQSASSARNGTAGSDLTPSAYERRLREAMAQADRGEGMVVSPEELAAIRREIEDLERRHVEGGTSPTLERLIREHEAKRAAAHG